VLFILSGPEQTMYCYAAINQSIRNMLDRDWTVKLVHTHREGNVCEIFWSEKDNMIV
jgi:hypothetical protein